MYFSEIKPFVRYAHYLYLNKTSTYSRMIPCDARLFFVSEGCGEIAVAAKSCTDNYHDSNRSGLSGSEDCSSSLNGNGSSLNNENNSLGSGHATFERYTLEKGDALLINSGVSYQLLPPKESVTYLAFNFDYTFSHTDRVTPVPPVLPESFTPDCIIEHVSFEDMPHFDTHCIIRGLHKATTPLSQIRTEYMHRLLYHEMKESQLFSQVLIEAARTLKTPVLQHKKGIAPRILDYIHEQYPQPLTNQKIAEVFGFHPNYVNALIKSCTGMSLHAYLLHVRLAYATDFLENSTLSIGEIAEACGFYDIFHFSRCFKQKMGVSPTEYRRLQC